MNDISYIGLVQNTAVLLSIALLFDFGLSKWKARNFRLFLIPIGILLGFVGIFIILTPWVFIPGIIFDTRSILLGISGLFFGIIPTSIAMLITAVFRIYQGGDGAVMGVLVIISSGTIGIFWNHFRKKSIDSITSQELYIFGLVIHVVMLICAFSLPYEIAVDLLKTIIVPVLLIYPIGTALLGLVIVSRLRYTILTQELVDEETHLKSLVDILQYQTANKNALLEYTLQEAIKITNSEHGYIYNYDEEQDQYTLITKLRSPTNQNKIYNKEIEVEWEEIAIYKEAVLQNNAIIINKGVFYPETVKKELPAHMHLDHYIAVPITNNNKIEALIALSNNESAYKEADILHLALLMDAVWRVTERQRVEKELSNIQWMLSKYRDADSNIPRHLNNDQLTDLNKDGVILHSVGKELLMDIAADYMDLLDTSAAIYEINGDYALAVFSSSWCKFLDTASYKLCKSDDISKSLKCEKWFCHQSCWEDASKTSMTSRQPVDIECAGGLHIYSVPIFASKEIVGAINFGYGDPPTNPAELKSIADKYQVDMQELQDISNAYESRPPFIVNVAKHRLHSSANLIGLLIERNQAQKDLKRSENNLNKIIDLLPVGVWFANKDGHLTRGNPAGANIWGAEPLVSLEEISIFHGRYYPSMEEITEDERALVRTIKHHSTIENELIEIDTFDGKHKIIRGYSTPILNAENELEGAVIVNLDVTEQIAAEENAYKAHVELEHLLQNADQARQVLLSVIEDQKMAEEKIQQLNQELEQRVKDRTTQLEVANRELEAFAYSVSHDLRAPLRAMDGFSSALIEDYPDKLDEQGRHYLGRIQQASQRMGQLIEDLLHLSRVTRREMILENVNLSFIAQEIAKDLQLHHKERDIQFNIKDNITVKADSHLIRIALENLISNAVKFSGNEDKAVIDMNMIEQDNEIIYYIRDNGVGFNMQYTNKLFSPFQRLHSMEEFPGTGIGLVTVQRIINRHGGRIWPEAKLDEGATFFFTLGG
ncbi:MAG: GAF domain-containing protein [Anaerolineaceae bacterium]|nr:GAF domain-containing protein [Anaerolineaceae bacterium]